MSFKPKQWKPNGWYYDDEKGKWIGPDFPSDESKSLSLRNVFKKRIKQPPKPSKEDPKWYPNGWYYDSKAGKWIGPDYEVTPDPEADIRLKRYYERRKAEGREPTYEEWKAARATEKHQD